MRVEGPTSRILQKRRQICIASQIAYRIEAYYVNSVHIEQRPRMQGSNYYLGKYYSGIREKSFLKPYFSSLNSRHYRLSRIIIHDIVVKQSPKKARPKYFSCVVLIVRVASKQ